MNPEFSDLRSYQSVTRDGPGTGRSTGGVTPLFLKKKGEKVDVLGTPLYVHLVRPDPLDLPTHPTLLLVP